MCWQVTKIYLSVVVQKPPFKEFDDNYYNNFNYVSESINMKIFKSGIKEIYFTVGGFPNDQEI